MWNWIKRHNCILCKYNKYNKNGDSCFDYQPKDEYGYPTEECHSLSNIYYGKIIKWFPFNIIQKIIDNVELKQDEDFYADFNEDGTENSEMKLVWGIKSGDDLSGSQCNLFTMNDFDITYFKKEEKYVLGVELVYLFKDYNAEKEYFNWILDKFTEWMEQNGYDTTRQIKVWQFGSIDLTTEYDSIEDVYAGFKYMVKGF